VSDAATARRPRSRARERELGLESPRETILVGPLPPPIDGQSLAFQLLARGLANAGDVAVVVNIARPGARFDRSRVARAFDYAVALSRYALALARHPRAGVYLTVAQSRAGFLRDFAFIGLARAARRRVTIHVHGGNYDGFYRSQRRWMQRRVRTTLGWTDAIVVLAERLRAMFDFAPELAARLHVVPNGLPEDPPRVAAKQPPAPGDPWRLLFLSNLIESKGYLELIEAVALLRAEGVAVELALCGEFRANPSDDRRVESAEQARSLTEALIHARGLAGHVQLRGVVRGEDKRRALAEAHVFVLPTRYDAEGQPLAIIEAMAWGCPVVASNHRGIPDLVEDGVTGILLAKTEPADIARALRRIFAEPGSLPRLGTAARARYEARFTPESHLRAVREVLTPRPPAR
jgi:glycosyltransferase involved in cell wall biosynthesis